MQIASFIHGESGSLGQLDRALWEIRHTVLLQLRHWKLRALGVWTVEPAEPAEAEAERLLSEFRDPSSAFTHGPAGFQA